MSEIIRKSSIQHSNFYVKLTEALEQPNKICSIYISFEKKWIIIKNIIELDKNYISFRYEGEYEGSTYTVEETILFGSILGVRLWAKLPDNIDKAKIQLNNILKQKDVS